MFTHSIEPDLEGESLSETKDTRCRARAHPSASRSSARANSGGNRGEGHRGERVLDQRERLALFRPDVIGEGSAEPAQG